MHMAIVDKHGNPYPLLPVLEHEQTASPRVQAAVNQMATHPSQRLTPNKLVAIFQEAENGDLIAQADLFMDMEEKDGQIFADMQKRKLVLTTLEKQVVPLGDATPQEKADADWLNRIVQSLDGWEDFILNMADGIGQGFSNQEIGWELYNREYYPGKFDWRPASWFMVNPERPDTLLLRTDDANGVPLRRFSWVSHKPKSRSGYVTRAGLMRTLAWPYIYRNAGIQGLAEMLEIYGMPIRIGKYPAGTGKTERNELLRAVTTLGRNGGGVMPDSMSMEIEDAITGSGDPYMNLADWAEKTISKIILGGTLTSQADGKTSTNALGLIHNEVRLDIMDADARQLATTIRSDLLYPLLFLNRNPQTDPRRTPKLIFPELEQMRQEAKAQAQSSGQTRVNVNFNGDGKTQNTPAAASSALAKRMVAVLKQAKNSDVPATEAGIDDALATLLASDAAFARMMIAALKQGQKASEPATEAGISEAIASLMASGKPSAQMAAILGPALEAVADTLTPDEMLGALAEVFPDMNVAPLSGCLGDYMEIARYIGQYAAQQEL